MTLAAILGGHYSGSRVGPLAMVKIETESDVERAIASLSGADRRTVKKWLTGSGTNPVTATGLRAVAAELGLTERVEEIRTRAKESA